MAKASGSTRTSRPSGGYQINGALWTKGNYYSNSVTDEIIREMNDILQEAGITKAKPYERGRYDDEARYDGLITTFGDRGETRDHREYNEPVIGFRGSSGDSTYNVLVEPNPKSSGSAQGWNGNYEVKIQHIRKAKTGERYVEKTEHANMDKATLVKRLKRMNKREIKNKYDNNY